MSESDRIDLAHVPGFALGSLEVRPGTRELVRDDGTVEVLEPRVMQVLVALAQANGSIVTRDDLTRRCWDDRIVGEDAINRVISRLRRSAEGIGGGAFRVETITKVGYRLVVDGTKPAGSEPVSATPRADRRWLIGGGVAAAGLAVLGIGYATREPGGGSTPVYPAEAAALIDQGGIALRSGSTESTNQAIGFFREVTARWPDLADGWGMLAVAYARSANAAPVNQVGPMIARSRAAAARALQIDPTNGFARASDAFRRPLRGQWLGIERDLRAAIAQRPDSAILRGTLASILGAVGRVGEQADILVALADSERPTPVGMYFRAAALWAAERLEEADRAMDEAYALYPMHFGVWFTRFYQLMYTGRVAQAIAMGEDVDRRPTGIPESNFASILAVARALDSRDPAAIDAVIAQQRALTTSGSGFAQNSMQFAAVLGRLDEAFAIIDAYYFGRGFQVPDIRFPGQQRAFTPAGNRHTYQLFYPSMAAVRADPRFGRVTAELGLERYWAESGTPPDYRR